MHENREIWDVLTLNNRINVDKSDINLANMEFSKYENEIKHSMIYDMECKILALPEERIVVNEVIYDSWVDHLLSKHVWLQKLFGKPNFRKISIDKKVYGSLITDRAVQHGRKHVEFYNLPTKGPRKCIS